jgi:hypothetical protein
MHLLAPASFLALFVGGLVTNAVQLSDSSPALVSYFKEPSFSLVKRVDIIPPTRIVPPLKMTDLQQVLYLLNTLKTQLAQLASPKYPKPFDNWIRCVMDEVSAHDLFHLGLPESDRVM